MKKLLVLLLLFIQSICFAQPVMPNFYDLPQAVQKDIGVELKDTLSISDVDLNILIKEVVIVADITRAMPGIDRAYLAIIEDSQYGNIKARFDIGIIYGTQGSIAGIMANFINYSL